MNSLLVNCVKPVRQPLSPMVTGFRATTQQALPDQVADHILINSKVRRTAVALTALCTILVHKLSAPLPLSAGSAGCQGGESPEAP